MQNGAIVAGRLRAPGGDMHKTCECVFACLDVHPELGCGQLLWFYAFVLDGTVGKTLVKH